MLNGIVGRVMNVTARAPRELLAESRQQVRERVLQFRRRNPDQRAFDGAPR